MQLSGRYAWRANKSPAQPQWKMSEISIDFKAPAQKIQALMHSDPNAPKGQLLSGSKSMYYPLHDMRKWWKSLPVEVRA